MGPPKTLRTISQESFDEVVRENVEDLGMDPTEALQDAIETLTLQGVDLSGDLWSLIRNRSLPFPIVVLSVCRHCEVRSWRG